MLLVLTKRQLNEWRKTPKVWRSTQFAQSARNSTSGCRESEQPTTPLLGVVGFCRLGQLLQLRSATPGRVVVVNSVSTESGQVKFEGHSV